MKDFWNARYGEDGFAYGNEPNDYLRNAMSQLSPGGKVLVVGDGEGRNGVWLAESGFDVFSVDYSSVAVSKIKSLANQRKVSLTAECHDLTEYQWPEAQFDAVISIYLHFPPDVRQLMHGKMLSALVAGGRLVLEAFNKSQLNYSSGGPPVEPMLFSESMLEKDFQDAKIITLYEIITQLKEGKYHEGDGAVVRMIAEKI